MPKTNFILFLASGCIMNLLFMDYLSAVPMQRPERQQNNNRSTLMEGFSMTAIALNRSLLPMEGLEVAKNSSNYSLLLVESGKRVDNENKQDFSSMEGVQNVNRANTVESLFPGEGMEGKKRKKEVSLEGVQNAGKIKEIKSLPPMEVMEIVKSYKNERYLPMESEKPLEYKNNPYVLYDVTSADKSAGENESLLPMEDMEIAESYENEKLLPMEGRKNLDNINSKEISVKDVQNGKGKPVENVLAMEDMKMAESAKIKSIFPRKHKTIIKSRKNLVKSTHEIDNNPLKLSNKFVLHSAIKNRKYMNIPQRKLYKLMESFRPLKDEYGAPRKSAIELLQNQPKANMNPPEVGFKKFPNLLKLNKNENLKEIIKAINEQGTSSNANLLVQENAPRNYYPDKHLEAVCIGRSTIYNKPVVVDWLKAKIYWSCSSDNDNWASPEAYSIWFAFRHQLFKRGRSEECHKPALNTWKTYLECALMRNQRMEFLIPKYPMHQL